MDDPPEPPDAAQPDGEPLPSELPTTPPVLPKRGGGGAGRPPARRGSFGVAALLGAVLLGGGGLVGIVSGAMAVEYRGVTEPGSAGLLTLINDDNAPVTGTCSGRDGATTPVSVAAGATTLLPVPARPVTCTFGGGRTWAAPEPASAAEVWVVRLTPQATASADTLAQATPQTDPAPAPTTGTRPADAAAEAAPRMPPRSAVKRKPVEAVPTEEAAAWSETDAAPSTPDLLTVVHIEVKRSGKLKGATATMDGNTINVPGQVAIKTGLHKLHVEKPDVITLDCTLAASGAAINVMVDPDHPACP